MDALEKQETTTGRPPETTPILASAEESTAAPSIPALAKNESASIESALTLALLQSDFSDLQSKGAKVSILARDNKLYASIELPGHTLSVSGTVKKAILLDGKAVTEYE